MKNPVLLGGFFGCGGIASEVYTDSFRKSSMISSGVFSPIFP
jgi:hypothetical protein